MKTMAKFSSLFQLTAARRRLHISADHRARRGWFQLTAARRRLRDIWRSSWPKQSFNSQPPKGGCSFLPVTARSLSGFNSQPPKGGCLNSEDWLLTSKVSTHSRPKAAAARLCYTVVTRGFQLTAAQRRLRDGEGSRYHRAGFQLTAAQRRLRIP